MEIIKAKIAKILSDTRVVLNAGFEDGVEEGMEFVIYMEGDEIFDPDTRASLGRLEFRKGRVRATNVQEKLTIAETRTLRIPSTPAMDLWRVFSTIPTKDRLTVDAVAATESERVSDDVVRVGDLVRSVPKQ